MAITKKALNQALDDLRKQADELSEQARTAWRNGSELDGSYYDGKAQGMRVAAIDIESKLAAL